MGTLNFQRLKRLREKRGLSQEECGAALGVTRSEYGRKEKGVTKFDETQLSKIAELLDVAIGDFYDSDGNGKPENKLKLEFEMINSLKGHIEALKKINEMHEARIKELEGMFLKEGSNDHP